jgi:hypothetical protein
MSATERRVATRARSSPQLGRVDSGRVAGVHVDNLVTFASEQLGELADLIDADQRRLELMQRWQTELSGYSILQSTRPQMLAYALTDVSL